MRKYLFLILFLYMSCLYAFRYAGVVTFDPLHEMHPDTITAETLVVLGLFFFFWSPSLIPYFAKRFGFLKQRIEKRPEMNDPKSMLRLIFKSRAGYLGITMFVAFLFGMKVSNYLFVVIPQKGEVVMELQVVEMYGKPMVDKGIVINELAEPGFFASFWFQDQTVKLGVCKPLFESIATGTIKSLNVKLGKIADISYLKTDCL